MELGLHVARGESIESKGSKTKPCSKLVTSRVQGMEMRAVPVYLTMLGGQRTPTMYDVSSIKIQGSIFAL